MTKADIVEQISNETGVDKKTTLIVVESMMSTIKANMVEGNDVFLRGFGSFIVKTRASKVGRNISQNTTVVIPEHNIPAFKPCKEFVKEVSKLED